jgi:ribonuclease P/MRP protein subunit POP1
MPFFSSLIYTGTRVGGQRERQTQAFEAGTAYFPRDFPTTFAYDQVSARNAIEDEETWRRKPPAKRPNYELLGTRSPWTADWDVVLGLQSSGDSMVVDQEYVPTQREPLTVQPEVKLWLLRGLQTSAIVRQLSQRFDAGAGLMEAINAIRAKHGLHFLDASTRDSLAKGALVTVQIKMVAEGSPDDLAMIYPMTDKQIQMWQRKLQQTAIEGAMNLEEKKVSLTVLKIKNKYI